MGLTRSQMDTQLAELYARIPRIPDCNGRCWTSCGPIDMSDRERQLIRQAGIRITAWEDARNKIDTYYCEALTRDKRCQVYELRPMICRLWGACESMRCPHGCVPEGGRWISDEEMFSIIAESQRIGGHPSNITMPQGAALRRAMQGERFLAEMGALLKAGQAGDLKRIEETIPAAFRRQRN